MGCRTFCRTRLQSFEPGAGRNARQTVLPEAIEAPEVPRSPGKNAPSRSLFGNVSNGNSGRDRTVPRPQTRPRRIYNSPGMLPFSSSRPIATSPVALTAQPERPACRSCPDGKTRFGCRSPAPRSSNRIWRRTPRPSLWAGARMYTSLSLGVLSPAGSRRAALFAIGRLGRRVGSILAEIENVSSGSFAIGSS